LGRCVTIEVTKYSIGKRIENEVSRIRNVIQWKSNKERSDFGRDLYQ